MEARARDISSGLRCLVCQNQSIDDSDAPLARDLRLIVRERLKAGDDDAQVQDYVVGRYGEYVLLRPVFALHTLLLWLTPVAVIGSGPVRPLAPVPPPPRRGCRKPQRRRAGGDRCPDPAGLSQAGEKPRWPSTSIPPASATRPLRIGRARRPRRRLAFAPVRHETGPWRRIPQPARFTNSLP